MDEQGDWTGKVIRRWNWRLFKMVRGRWHYQTNCLGETEKAWFGWETAEGRFHRLPLYLQRLNPFHRHVWFLRGFKGNIDTNLLCARIYECTGCGRTANVIKD